MLSTPARNEPPLCALVAVAGWPSKAHPTEHSAPGALAVLAGVAQRAAVLVLGIVRSASPMSGHGRGEVAPAAMVILGALRRPGVDRGQS